MTVRPGWGRRGRLVLLGALVAGLIVPAAAVAGSVSHRLPTAPDDQAVTVSLTSIEPVTVRPGRRLAVAGTVRTERSLHGVTVALEVGTTPYLSRSELPEPAPTPTVAIPAATDRLGRVPPGTAAFAIAVPADSLPVGSTGVYPLRVRVTSIVDEVPRTQATVDTFLPWQPADEGLDPTPLLWFWPLVDRPRRDSQGRFFDDGLAAELGPTGRLSRLVAAADGYPVTWLVDPALLADATALTGPYQLVGSSQPNRPADPAAAQFITDLRSATDGAELVGLPFGDPDLVAITQAHRGGLLDDGRRTGERVFAEVLGRTARFDLVWPAEGFADEAALDALAAGGATSILLSGEAVPLVDLLPWTPSGRADLADSRLAGLLTDPALDDIVADPGTGTGALLLARQTFLAQTLLLTLELPNDARLAVVTPPRRWDPDPPWPRALLDATRRAGWLRMARLDPALRREAPTAARAEPRLPEEVSAAQVPADLVAGAAVARAQLLPFRAILTDKTPADLINQALLGTLSTAWRALPEVAAVQLAGASEHLGAERNKVRILTRAATLSAESAPLPVTIRNQLGQPVRVRLDVTTSDPVRLRATAPDEVLSVESGSSLSVSVELDAVTTGRLEVAATLLTPRGRVYSEPTTIPVDVRAYGQIAVIVFGLAFILLLLAVVVRLVRRVRARRAAS